MKEDLIYDIGLHRGEDTDYYLKKGFRVIAVEANLDLVNLARVRFKDAIASNNLRIIHGAIAPASTGDTVIFYTNRNRLAWGTTRPDWATRNDNLGYPSEQREVARVDIAELFRAYGVPHYLKVDIEGADRIVLSELRTLNEKPHYLSIESEKVKLTELKAEMEELRGLGYTKFNIVQQQSIPGTKLRTQSLHGVTFDYIFEPDSSGPFGNDLSTSWVNYQEALEQYSTIFHRYKYFGDNALINKLPRTGRSVVMKLYRAYTGYVGPLPGWHDTHASR